MVKVLSAISLKKGALIIDKESVTAVCIDDFALKKRENYGALMVDINTHNVIDMINSRELNDVTNWLKTYLNIQIVSRDGSITYHNAITASHPNALQISDRFHLFKNLTDYCKDYLNKELKAVVTIPITQASLDLCTEKLVLILILYMGL